jgi:F0F1-type ATP synthase assembly protein I
MPEKPKSSFENMREAGELSVIGLTLVFATAIGYYIGHWIEQKWPGLKPWGGVTGALVGIVAGYLEMIRTLRRINRRLEKQNERRKHRDDHTPG